MFIEKGKLTVIIVEADIKRDVETFSKMDPLVSVEWTDSETGQKQSFETKSLDEAGMKPFWGFDPTNDNSFTLEASDFQ